MRRGISRRPAASGSCSPSTTRTCSTTPRPRWWDATVAAERTGLAVSEQSGKRVFIRLAHPLYAEIIRARLTPARIRRSWDRIAAAMAGTPMRRRDDHLFAGLAHLRAQRRTDPDLLLTAARRAYARVDLDLAEALARAA